jgi:tetratricopeptide (TPR) repeat protein
MLIPAASLLLVCTFAAPAVQAQVNTDRRTAMTSYRLGFEHMRAERLDEAAAAFQAATEVDRTFEMAYYMLGRVRMLQRRYVEASAAFSRSRALFQNAGGRQFTNAQEAQRFRRDQLTELDELIRQLQSGPQTMQTQDQLRQLSDRRRALLENIQRGDNMSLMNTVPAFVSLSLGSAYFRMGNLTDAEKAYKETIAADAKVGEAHNNLAVVYLETGRLDEAEKAVAAAEKAGFKVQPQLKEEIRNRRRSGRGGTR